MLEKQPDPPESSHLIQVAIRSPLRKLFTYESDQPLQKGVRVAVPFRSKKVLGFVWEPAYEKVKGLKKISEVYDSAPFYDERSLQFYERAALYYGSSLGELLSGSICKAIREGKEPRLPDPKKYKPNLVQLSAAQKEILEQIQAQAENFKSHLLMGETGSGKTEIYLHLMEGIIAAGGQVLYLVPEISLTPQLERRLNERMGGKISVFHSKTSEKKREEIFARARAGQTDIFLGARSALFLPMTNLKLIVVDEEHDSSFKQSERAPYHARDLAVLKAQLLNIPIVLGSATPSLETYHRAEEQAQPIYRIKAFYPAEKPSLEIVDLKAAWKEDRSFISPPLQKAIEENLEKNEQSLLFLNRRGTNSVRICTGCGTQDECPHCSVNLTIHADLKVAICHWCNFRLKLSYDCIVCGSKDFFFGGVGTKEIERILSERFPEARIARLDRDQMTKKDNLPRILSDFEDAKIDILVGTQLIAKGIDIAKLSLVGVCFADQGWGLPDFRATERSFQMLKQLMGRGGRRGQKSRFIVQTFSPQHPLFSWINREENAYENFAKDELEVRKIACLPPYVRLALWTLSYRDERLLNEEAKRVYDRFARYAEPLGIQLIGPAVAPLSRWKGQYRMHILCKSAPKGSMTTFLNAALDDLEKAPMGIEIRLDRDPQQFL